jgi:hypothetical protein
MQAIGSGDRCEFNSGAIILRKLPSHRTVQHSYLANLIVKAKTVKQAENQRAHEAHQRHLDAHDFVQLPMKQNVFYEISLFCKFTLFDSNMIHTKTHDNFTFLFKNLLTRSHYRHSAVPINMTLAFGQCALSWIYISHRVSLFHHSV